jgi:hypothetical protein
MMVTTPGLDELFRAAEAAGFAMAAPDDEPASAVPATPVAKFINVEDLARGARDVRPVQSRLSTSGVIAAKDAHGNGPTMRETLYGYLRFGVPA